MQEALSSCLCFNSGRLFLSPETDYSHIELEIVRTSSGIRMYLNVLFLQAYPYPENPQFTKVDIQWEDDEQPRTVYAYLLQGNQRLLFPGDVADILIQSLLDNRPFTIILGRNRSTIIPDQFEELYSKLLAIPLEEEPPKGCPQLDDDSN